MLCVFGGEHVCPVGGVMCVFVWWERSNAWTEKPKFYLFWRGRRCLVGIVVSRLVLQLVVRQQLQGGSLHLQLTAAWAAGGEADGASTSAGGDGVDRIFFFFLKWMSDSDFYLRRFFRVWTSRLRPSLASVASSSSRCSFLREALDRVASSSASSSWRFSCFIREFDFSTLKTKYQPNVRKYPDIY